MTEPDPIPQTGTVADVVPPTDDAGENLVTAVVHFRVLGRNIPDAEAAARTMFADALETNDLFADGAVATVLAT